MVAIQTDRLLFGSAAASASICGFPVVAAHRHKVHRSAVGRQTVSQSWASQFDQTECSDANQTLREHSWAIIPAKIWSLNATCSFSSAKQPAHRDRLSFSLDRKHRATEAVFPQESRYSNSHQFNLGKYGFIRTRKVV